MFEIDPATFEEAKEVLKSLVRIDTSNPPGNERPATELVERLLAEEGLESTIIEPLPDRTNLICRQKGDGSLPPLLMSCHLDVVPADPRKWTHPPFSAHEADGCIWGRGTIDMKGFATMALMVFRLLKRNKVALKRDIIFAAVADEEDCCDLGSGYLVAHHPDLVRAEYVINEVGGFSVEVRGKRYYLVQSGERGIAWLRIRVTGQPGHSAKPTSNSAMEQAGEVISKLTKARFPHHVCDTVRAFLLGMSEHATFTEAAVMKGLTKPKLGQFLLHTLVPPGQNRDSSEAILSNSVNPTIVRGGSKINVVPAEVVIDVDGRTSPTSSAEELMEEVRKVIGPKHSMELIREEPGREFSRDTPVFEEIMKILRERDPEANPLPYLVYGVTDSRNYAKLGATCYGFYPVKMPPGMEFYDLFHGDDERIPVEGFKFGIEALYDLMMRVAT